MKVQIVKTEPNAKLPEKAHNIDNGYDFFAASYTYDEEIDAYIYSTGVSIGVPVGYSLDIIPKSRHRKKFCYMPNTPSDIDPGYTGTIYVTYKPILPKVVYEICVSVLNYFPSIFNKNFNIIRHMINKLDEYRNPPYGVGQEIAQGYLTPHPDMEFEEVDKLPESERGDKGHGSTGDGINN